jgi:hypothetical protein
MTDGTRHNVGGGDALWQWFCFFDCETRMSSKLKTPTVVAPETWIAVLGHIDFGKFLCVELLISNSKKTC